MSTLRVVALQIISSITLQLSWHTYKTKTLSDAILDGILTTIYHSKTFLAQIIMFCGKFLIFKHCSDEKHSVRFIWNHVQDESKRQIVSLDQQNSEHLIYPRTAEVQKYETD